MIRVDHLELVDTRSYRSVQVDLAPGLTVITGDNGQGKTNLLEAVGYLADQRSFRGAPTDALIHRDADSAVIRARAARDGRDLLLEAELHRTGRNRYQVNRQPVRRTRDLRDVVRVSAFLPDDLVLVKGGPSYRRAYLDALLIQRSARGQGHVSEFERVLKQRNALLKQARGRLTGDIETTLSVWDERLVATGEALGAARVAAVDALRPVLVEAYHDIAGQRVDIDVVHAPAWMSGGLMAALADHRDEELRRGVSVVGPHRDDITIGLDSMPARTHASQGEQRTLALALRLAGHRLVTDALGTPPVLLLDDIFSELDPSRADALLAHLPEGQVLLTTATGAPPGATPDLLLRVADGTVSTR